MRCKNTTALRANRNTQQLQRLLEKVGLVIAVVLLKPFGSKAVQARVAPVMLWA